MKISYNWLREYLPSDEVFSKYINNIHKISDILTAVGLEVETVEPFESIRGRLEGLIVAEVLTCEKHPDADKLKITTVSTGKEKLQIICGAPNVAAGQKVIVAPAGTTLYPLDGEPFKIKKAKIRGIESNGMICAEDEIGTGSSHEGIIVLPENSQIGEPASEIFQVYTDYLIEIGLTPNRMDGQSHLGVAKDVCAWLSHHTGKKAIVISPLNKPFSIDDQSMPFQVEVKDPRLAPRYSGVTISNIKIEPSPQWIQNKLKVIGLRPVNNVVDITNFVLHATGQPLHAFDADKIKDRHVIVEQLAENTPFITLDTKERKLSSEDIMICDGGDTPMCIGGIFGGLVSGVTGDTKNIFLESAVFNPAFIRKSMIRHDLRTDAATRFEKGVDISKTLEVLKYSATLIRDICKGKISSAVTDIFEKPARRVVTLKYAYLKKLSGRDFKEQEVKNILSNLGFVVMAADDSSMTIQVPESNPDILLPADIVEEILRISGLDNIPIPDKVRMSPGSHGHSDEYLLIEKVSAWLTGNGFLEIFTNSITNDKYFEDNRKAVRILNSLSEELTLMRTDMLPTGLEAIEHNLNRQSKDLLFFEFGKTYSHVDGKYYEKNHLSILCTGEFRKKSWNSSPANVSLFFVKGVANAIFSMADVSFIEMVDGDGRISFRHNEKEIGYAYEVRPDTLQKFSVKQPVYCLDIDWDKLKEEAGKINTVYRPVSRFPAMTRDLSMIVEKNIAFGEIRKMIDSLHLKKLSDIRMFDLYENEKIGKGKKSIALSFSFGDSQKTLTDKETDKMMQQISHVLEKEYSAEIRSHA